MKLTLECVFFNNETPDARLSVICSVVVKCEEVLVRGVHM